MPTLANLQKRMGVSFHNEALLRRALTHRSFLNEHPEESEDNERLEFLGDAVLDFLIAATLYHRFPEMSEGQLTALRSALVRTEQLASFARHLDVGAALRVGKGEAEAGGRERESVLCSTFEAIIGALYLDAGIEAVTAMVAQLFLPRAQEIVTLEADADAKSQFQVWAQEHRSHTPRYRTVKHAGPDHDREFTVVVLVDGVVYGTGTGRSKKAAEQSAALEALRRAGLA
ncbi:MAG TPA: ribonuclease III [Anaerolineales bacterium]|nr:ribonuclease III [Anaerolineales bacterium]